MRNADTVLGIIHERGTQGLPLEDIYRQLYNPHLYTRAYERLRTNKGAISPILSNVYLDRLDTFVETTLLPAYNRGERRRYHPVYARIASRLRGARARGDADRAHELEKQRRTVPYGDPQDPHYRRLTYLRYADDFLLGFIGPKAEAEEIKERLRAYLCDTLKLELSEDKTLITHARSTPARFLGYEIQSQHRHDKLDHRGRRCVNDIVALRVPGDVVDQHCRRYMRRGEPALRAELCHASDYAIVRKYQADYRGLVQYYLLATNVHRLSKLTYVMETSLLKTLAAKHRTTVTAVARKYRATTETPHGPMKCLRVTVDRGEEKPPLVAEFGGIPLRRVTAHAIIDAFPRIWMHRTDLLARLLADECELCGWKGECHVHHIHKMADLHQRGRREKPAWAKRMIALRRKTLVVCQPCHAAIHAGRLSRPGIMDTSPESRVR